MVSHVLQVLGEINVLLKVAWMMHVCKHKGHIQFKAANIHIACIVYTKPI
jgi:hypothetical protein